MHSPATVRGAPLRDRNDNGPHHQSKGSGSLSRDVREIRYSSCALLPRCTVRMPNRTSRATAQIVLMKRQTSSRNLD
jgi:hypothetical protein